MINAKLFNEYARNPEAFRASLLVDVDGTARKFGDVQDDWQLADFAALDPALRACVGRSTEDTLSRFYFERARGHSKTTDLAVTCVWALTFSIRPLRGYCFAADRDQAGLLRNAIDTIIRLNPWLGEIISIQRDRIVNIASGHPGETGELIVSTSDVASSYGILPDIIIADELTHWLGDGSLWHSLISSAAKRTNCLLVVISNAGFVDSWQWAVRETARTDPAWYFSRLDGPVASWMTPARLAEQRRMLPQVAYARLWLNEWSSGGGDALTPDDIDAAFFEELQPVETKQPGFLYVTGVDLGLTRDCSAVVTLAVAKGGGAGRIRLAQHRLWTPQRGSKISLIEVENYILDLDKTFGLENVAVDPWQAELLCQRLEVDSGHRRRNSRRRFWTKPWIQPTPPTSINCREQCSLTIESFQDRRFLFYDCPVLKRDLLRLRIEEKSYGFRLTSPRDGDGHGDTFSAFVLALQVAHQLAGRKRVTAGIGDGTGRTPLQRELDRLDREADLRAAERELLSGPDHAEQFRDLMRLVGRSH